MSRPQGPVCHRSLRRYWIELAEPASPAQVGVTAESLEAALQLAREQAFGGAALPTVQRITEDVDVSTLDPVRVLPFAAPSALRGVWFPGNVR